MTNILKLQHIHTIITNQKHLLTTLNLHNTIISIKNSKKSTSNSYLKKNLFSKIPTNHTYTNLSIKPSTIYKYKK